MFLLTGHFTFFPYQFFQPHKGLDSSRNYMSNGASVSENRMVARQQKTDANYLPVSAVEQHILWHLLCLIKVAIVVGEVAVSWFRKDNLYDLGLQTIFWAFQKMTRWKMYSTSYKIATKVAILTQTGITRSYTLKAEFLDKLSENRVCTAWT